MGHTYVVFNGRVLGIYDSWLDVSRQVHKFPNANHKSYKDRREAEAAYMEYLYRNGMNVQGGASASGGKSEHVHLKSIKHISKRRNQLSK